MPDNKRNNEKNGDNKSQEKNPVKEIQERVEKLLKRRKEDQVHRENFSASKEKDFYDDESPEDTYVYPGRKPGNEIEDGVKSYGYEEDTKDLDISTGDNEKHDSFFKSTVRSLGEKFKESEEGRLSLEEEFQENYAASKKRLNRSVKAVGTAVAILFVAIFSYIVYFEYARAYALKTDPGNRRMAILRNRVIRGSILDRDGKIISESVLNDDGSQERLYHGGEAFGPILGFVSPYYDVSGIESAMDAQLSSTGSVKSLFSYAYLYNLITGQRLAGDKNTGNNVMTTLDSDLQFLGYSLLKGKKGSLVALDPSTGEILAMVSSPGFDPSELSEVMSRVNNDPQYAATGVLTNRALQSTYPPGSTFKAVTLAAALKNIEGSEKEIYKDSGFIEFADGTKLPNYNGNALGNITLQEAFTYSSNVVFGNFAMDMGSSRLKETAEDFGFNKKWNSTGINPEISQFPEIRANQQGLIAQSGIGQGEVTATPLQMCMVAAGTANNGKVMLPQIIKETTDSRGTVLSEFKPDVLFGTLDEETAVKVKNYMAGNVSSGYGPYGQLQSVNGAGKTGTAEFSSGDGLRLNSWFIGFAPQDNPKIAVAVVLEDRDNTDENLGGASSLPVALEIMENYLHKR